MSSSGPAERGDRETGVEFLTEWPVQKQLDMSESLKEKSLKRSQTQIHSNSIDVKKLKCASVPSVSPATLQLTSSDHSVSPEVLLSRWWKKQRESDKQNTLSSSSNPRTSLHQLAKLPEGQEILTLRIAHLQQSLSEAQTSEEWLLHFNLASCYHKLSSDLHTTSLALAHVRKATQLQPGEVEVEWLLELLVRQKEVEEEKNAREKDVLGTDLVFSMPPSTQVERRHARELSLRQFITEYALAHTPVVITGLVDHMTSTPWTLAHIRKRVGRKVAPLRRTVSGSVEWARLESAGNCTVSNFIDSLDTNKDKKYLFDWGLPLSCPELVSELSIPKYFANDFLQRTPEGSLYRDSWPSLFIAPAGLTSELHVDAFGSNFWMALFQGKKRWVFFPPEDTPLLYPVYAHSTDAVFEADLSSPDPAHHPLLAHTHPQECLLEPGEVLYVPAGRPHRVQNLENSLAISANFVNCSNFDLVKTELRANALVDNCAKQLLEVMLNDTFDSRMRGLDQSQPILNEIETMQNKNEGSNSNCESSKIETSETDTLCVSWEDFKQQTMHL